MKSSTVTVITFLFLPLILSGCNFQAAGTQELLLEPTPAISPPISTATIFSTFTPSPTISPMQATQTAVHPTFAVMAQTQEHYMFTAVPATLEARNAMCKDGFGLEKYLDILRYSNDQWTLFTCSPLANTWTDSWTPGVLDFGTRYTQIINVHNSKSWIIQHNTFDYSIIDRPDALLAPFHWTEDGKFLYLYPARFPSGSGGADSRMLKDLIDDLYRINLETGKFELIIARNQYNALALSPDNKHLAYSEQRTPDIVHIKNMETGSDLQVKLNEDIIVAGRFVWNSESTKVVFAVGYSKPIEHIQDDLTGTAIFVLTLKDMHVKKILAKDARIFLPDPCFDNAYWSDEKTLCLYATNEELDSWNTFFTIDIETGAVTYLRPFP